MKLNKTTIRLILTVVIIAIGAFLKYRSNHSSATDVGSAITQSGSSYLAEANQNNPDIHLMLGIPQKPSASNNVIIKRTQYVLSYNPDTRNPDWVCWNLSGWWYGDQDRHKGPFMPDPELPKPNYRVTHRDYTNSGFDRGHLVRSEERTRNEADNDATFYTTNIIPQYHELNAGPWLRLEELCETLAKRKNKEMFVIAGPIYSNDMGTIGNGVKVPSESFKIIVMLEKGQGVKDITKDTRVIAVRMPNRDDIQSTQWREYETTVEDIERATGYTFFSALPKDIQQQLKKSSGKDAM